MTTNDIEVLGRKPADYNWKPVILTDLASMQAFVEGLIERIQLPMAIDLWVNEEFLFTDEKVSVLLRYENDLGHMKPIKGNVFLAGTDKENNMVQLTDEQKNWIKHNSQVVFYKPNLIPVWMVDLHKGGC